MTMRDVLTALESLKIFFGWRSCPGPAKGADSAIIPYSARKDTLSSFLSSSTPSVSGLSVSFSFNF